MWQRFTERARRAIWYSQEEAQQFGEGYVSTEHLLLGLIRVHDGTATRALESLGVSLGGIRKEMERQLPRGDARPSQNMTLTPRAKRVIDLAYDQARTLQNDYIGTEHLLLGLILEGDGLAGRVLAKSGVKLAPVHAEVVRLQLGEDGHGKSRPPEVQTEELDPRQAAARRLLLWRALFTGAPDSARLSDLVVLAVASDQEGMLRLVLQRCGMTPSSLVTSLFERAFEHQTGDPSPGPSPGELFTRASEEAAGLKSPTVMPHHLLLALLAEGNSCIAEELTKAGLTVDAMRQAITELERPS